MQLPSIVEHLLTCRQTTHIRNQIEQVMSTNKNIPSRCTGAGKTVICPYRDECQRYEEYKKKSANPVSLMDKPEGEGCYAFVRARQ